jgi:AcrR family transcriptional regulator
LSSGLRDRHRLQTLRELHEAAVELARESGLAAATVDAITKRAGVSRRTFFNYYPTKEDALLGTASPVVPAEALERFLGNSGDDGFADALRLVIAIVSSARQVDIPIGERARLIVEFPSLKERFSQHVSAAEGLIATALDERPTSGARLSLGRDADSARALLMLASTVLRFAYTRDPAGADGVAGPSAEAIESAISVFRHVLQEIS